MKKYSKFFVAGIILIVFIATFVFLWMKSQPQPVAYEEFTPALKDIRKTTVITGKIEPRNEINIKPQISGIIVKLYKEAGQHVQAGEVIAKVKVIPDESQLSSAQARIRLAAINARQAKIDYDRMNTLYNKGLVSGDEYDQKRKALQQADEEVRAANENLEVVRDGVSAENASTSSTLIRSTVSGLILDIPVKVGNTVILSNTFNDGTTIATVADMNEASLEYISPKATEANGTNQFEIKAALHGLGTAQIRSGYSATAEIVLAQANQVLTVPESAIEFQGNNTYVYIIHGTGKEKTYTKKRVTTGLSDGINIQITSGLTKTDKVRGPKIVKDENNSDEQS